MPRRDVIRLPNRRSFEPLWWKWKWPGKRAHSVIWQRVANRGPTTANWVAGWSRAGLGLALAWSCWPWVRMHSCPTLPGSCLTVGSPGNNAQTKRTPSLCPGALGRLGLCISGPFENVQLVDWAPHSDSGPAIRQRGRCSTLASTGLAQGLPQDWHSQGEQAHRLPISLGLCSPAQCTSHTSAILFVASRFCLLT